MYRIFVVYVILLFCSAVSADEAHDHPLVSAHPDAVIKHYIQKRYDRYELLEGPLVATDCCTLDSKKTQTQTLEGKVTRIVYEVPGQVSSLELLRSYSEKLKDAGYEVSFECRHEACGKEAGLYESFNANLNVVYGFSYLTARSSSGDVHIALAFVESSDPSYEWVYSVDVIEKREFDNRVNVLPASKLSKFSAAGNDLPVPINSDVPGASDHPLFPRHPSAWIHKYSQSLQAQYQQLVGPIQLTGCCEIDRKKTSIDSLNGKLTQLLYMVPLSITSFELMHSYRESLEMAGYHILFECHNDGCGGYQTFDDIHGNIQPVSEFDYLAAASEDDRIRVSLAIPNTSGGYRSYGLHVLEREDAINRVRVLSPDQLQDNLAKTGKAVLGGIHFEHDSARIMKGSEQALSNVATMLNSDSDIKVFVVGHTDNTGSFDYNRDLSQKRARAVVDYLVTKHGVERDRMRGFGIASLSPAQSNRSKAGRAQNRRVELVLW